MGNLSEDDLDFENLGFTYVARRYTFLYILWRIYTQLSAFPQIKIQIYQKTLHFVIHVIPTF